MPFRDPPAARGHCPSGIDLRCSCPSCGVHVGIPNGTWQTCWWAHSVATGDRTYDDRRGCTTWPYVSRRCARTMSSLHFHHHLPARLHQMNASEAMNATARLE
eukprot:scaffold1518_cov417-Prasinococcus_capsulatus_cf.AAC.32